MNSTSSAISGLSPFRHSGLVMLPSEPIDMELPAARPVAGECKSRHGQDALRLLLCGVGA